MVTPKEFYKISEKWGGSETEGSLDIFWKEDLFDFAKDYYEYLEKQKGPPSWS